MTRSSPVRISFGVAWRLARIEIISLGVVLIALNLVASLVAARLSTANADSAGELLRGAGYLFTVAGIAVPATGLLLGVPIVSREIERGTALMSWSISPSRLSWLRFHVMPLLLGFVAITGWLALSTNDLEQALHPSLPASMTFEHYGQRDLLLLWRGLLGLGVGLLAGALMGRVLPSLLVAILLYFMAFGIGQLGTRAYFGDDAGPLNDGARGSWQLDYRPDPVLDRRIAFGLRGDRYGEVAAFETQLQVGLTVTAFAAAWITVERRRPY